ncbi:MAG: secretory subunit [Watsoniomyces obsoletus]|nr:MAG: secretory subunit [Watsoniomyces obsoletus]
MHLSNLFPWLVVAGSVIGHPIAQFERPTDRGRRIKLNKPEGDHSGHDPNKVAGAAVTWTGMALTISAPRIFRWYNDRPPSWLKEAEAYSEQSPEERTETKHQLLKRVRFKATEWMSINSCKASRFLKYQGPGSSEETPRLSITEKFPREKEDELRELKERADIECRAEALNRRLEWYKEVQSWKQKTPQAKATPAAEPEEGSNDNNNKNQFSLSKIQFPKFNAAAMASTLSRAVSRAASQPKLVPGL